MSPYDIRFPACKFCLFIMLALGFGLNPPTLHGQSGAPVCKAGKNENSDRSAPLSFGGSLRFRFESCQNFNGKDYGKDGDGFLLERLRLHADLRPAKGLRIFAELQDAHVWGAKFGVDDFNGSSPYENPLDLRQLFLQWDRVAGTPWGVKLGRQEIHFADNRIFGPGDWGNVGSHLWDAAVVDYDGEPFRTDIFYGRRVRYDSAAWNFDDRHYSYDVAGMYMAWKRLPVALDLFAVAKMGRSSRLCGTQAVERERRFTVGFRLEDHLGAHVDYGGLIAFQGGRWGHDRIRTLAAHARLGYAFHGPWQVRLAAEWAFGSGDRQGDDGVSGTWDGVFGSRDRLYGRMNLMTWSNLVDYQLTLQAKPWTKVALQIDGHFFFLASRRDGWYYSPSRALRHEPTGGAGSRLGQEIDLTGEWQIAKKWNLLLIGGCFVPDVFIERTGPAGMAHWTTLQVLHKF